MKYVLMSLLLALSCGASALPITWTLDEQECRYTGGEWFCAFFQGSFDFDIATGNYSDVNLVFYFAINGPAQGTPLTLDDMLEGDRFRMLFAPVPGSQSRLGLAGYDLADPVRQAYDWGAWDAEAQFLLEGRHTMTPGRVSLPAPGTLPLLGLALLGVAWPRRLAGALARITMKQSFSI